MTRQEAKNELVFNFQDDDVKRLIRNDVQLQRRMRQSFDFIYDKLKGLNHHMVATKKLVIPDNDQYRESGLFMEGKSYHWTSIDCGDVKFLIRKYSEHLTIFVRFEETHKHKSDTWTENRYSAFELYTDTDIEYEKNENGKSDIKDYHEDFFWCNPFYDFNLLINPIIKMIRKNHLHAIWNSVSIPRPDRVKLELYFDGEESISSIDKMIYGAEELSRTHLELFAESEMLEKLKTLKVGDMLSAYKITGIKTEVKNDYYHGVGLNMVNTNFDDSDEKWSDVYTLSRYYFEYLFPVEKSDELSESDENVLTEHYRKIALKMLDETTDKTDLTHIKEAMRNFHECYGKIMLFAHLIQEEEEAQEKAKESKKA